MLRILEPVCTEEHSLHENRQAATKSGDEALWRKNENFQQILKEKNEKFLVKAYSFLLLRWNHLPNRAEARISKRRLIREVEGETLAHLHTTLNKSRDEKLIEVAIRSRNGHEILLLVPE